MIGVVLVIMSIEFFWLYNIWLFIYLYGVNEQPCIWHKTIKCMQSTSNVLVKNQMNDEDICHMSRLQYEEALRMNIRLTHSLQNCL